VSSPGRFDWCRGGETAHSRRHDCLGCCRARRTECWRVQRHWRNCRAQVSLLDWFTERHRANYLIRKIDRVFKPQLPESERRRRLERFYNAAPRAGQWREDDRLEVRHTHERMSLGAALAWLIIGVLIGIGATVYTVGLWYPRQ
jgi:hypothetical protein